jgi:hypothetical protein
MSENGKEIVKAPPAIPQAPTMQTAPEIVLAEAVRAAHAVFGVITTRPRRLSLGGKPYPFFEDWQTCGKFYGITAGTVSTKFLQMGAVRGFEAVAEAIDARTGQRVSSAEAMCMSDEPNWAKKPLFQLRSMAQTRACAKALRNVLGWVMVLGDFEPTLEDELEDEPEPEPKKAKPRATQQHTEKPKPEEVEAAVKPKPEEVEAAVKPKPEEVEAAVKRILEFPDKPSLARYCQELFNGGVYARASAAGDEAACRAIKEAAQARRQEIEDAEKRAIKPEDFGEAGVFGDV